MFCASGSDRVTAVWRSFSVPAMLNDVEANSPAVAQRRPWERATPPASKPEAPVKENTSNITPSAVASPTPASPLFRPILWIPMLSVAAILSAALTWQLRLTHGLFLECVAMVICAVAAWTDAATARIPNRLTYPAILIGLVGNLVAPLLLLPHVHALDTLAAFLGPVGTLNSLAGAAVCVVIGIACMLLPIGGSNAMGGGDLKLIVALGAFLGIGGAPIVLLLSLVIAVPLALLNLAAGGELNRLLQTAALQVSTLAYTARPARTEIPLSGRTIPLAIPLACGLLLALVWPHNPISTFLGL
jgi:prepilin peptidase CpaA